MKKNKSKIFICCALLFINSFVISKVSAVIDGISTIMLFQEAIRRGYTPVKANAYVRIYPNIYAKRITKGDTPMMADTYANMYISKFLNELGSGDIPAVAARTAHSYARAYNAARRAGYTPIKASIYADIYIDVMYYWQFTREIASRYAACMCVSQHFGRIDVGYICEIASIYAPEYANVYRDRINAGNAPDAAAEDACAHIEDIFVQWIHS
ncbi:MAG: hypothetical protein LBR79_01000 [Oscillospiraceae bacterium]|jgi:hypothetical protein|nr:hypothetical protein [Oscillospiraceae bacterium]